MQDLVIEFAGCQDESCAPPPVGTGGSKPGGDGQVPAWLDDVMTREFPPYVRVVGMENQDHEDPSKRSWTRPWADDESQAEFRLARNIAEHVRPDRIEVAVGRWSTVGILDSGRLKNQHETNSSNGYLDPEMRRRAEQVMFGFPDETLADQLPVYGYVGDSSSSPEWYGEIALRLKPSVAARTTVTFGDSLFMDATKSIRPVPIGKVRDLTDSQLAQAIRPTDVRNYVEAQIHGGVSLDDVADVVLRVDDVTDPLDFKGRVERTVAFARKLGKKRVIVASAEAFDRQVDIAGAVEDLAGLAEAAVPGFEFVHELPVGLTASAVSVLEFYSPDQPRDAAGRWTKSRISGGGKVFRAMTGRNTTIFNEGKLPKWIERGVSYDKTMIPSIPEKLEQAALDLRTDQRGWLSTEETVYDAVYSLGYSVPRDRKLIVEALSAGAPTPKQQVVLEILRQVHQEMADDLAAGGYDSIELGRISAETSPFRTEAKRWTWMANSEPGPPLVPGLTSWSMTPQRNAEKDWANEFPNPEEAKTYVLDIPVSQVLGRGGLVTDEVLVADDSRMIEALMASRDSVELRGVPVYPISTFAEREDTGAPAVRAAGALEFYSADQPRGEDGRWVKSGGSGGSIDERHLGTRYRVKEAKRPYTRFTEFEDPVARAHSWGALYDYDQGVTAMILGDRQQIVDNLSSKTPDPKVLSALQYGHRLLVDTLKAQGSGRDGLYLHRTSRGEDVFETTKRRWGTDPFDLGDVPRVPTLTSWSADIANNPAWNWQIQFPSGVTREMTLPIHVDHILARAGALEPEFLVFKDTRSVEALMAWKKDGGDGQTLRGVPIFPISTFAEREDARSVTAASELEFYSPDQPRDAEGRWTSGSGGGGEKVFKLEPGVRAFDYDRQAKRATELLVGNPRFKDQVERALRGEPSDLDDIAVDGRADFYARVHDLEESLGFAVVGASSAARLLIGEALYNGNGTKASGSITPDEFEKVDGRRLADVIAQGVVTRMSGEWRSGRDSLDTGLKLQMQQAASFQFDVQWDTPPSVVPNGTVAAAVYAVYRSTQEEFKLGGFTHVRIYRGLTFDSGPKGLMKSREAESMIMASGKVRGNPMSSWTTQETVAKFFQTAQYHGILLSSVVPVSEVISYHGKGGFGSEPEREVILTGGEIPAKIEAVSKDDYVPSAWHEMSAEESVEFYSPDQPRDKEGQWTKVGGDGSSFGNGKSPTENREAMLSTMDEFEWGSKKFAGVGAAPHLSGAIESKVNGSVRVGKKLAESVEFRAWVDGFEDSVALRAVLVDRQYNELAMDGGVSSSGGTLDLLAAGWNGQGRSGTGRLMRDGLTLNRIAEESGLSKYEVIGRAIGERLNNAQMHWCGGSGDPLSYSVQHSVHAEFGAGEMADYVREPRLKLYGAAGAEYIHDPEVMRVVGMAVRARYEVTQDLLGELGYGPKDGVRVYRGMSVYEDDHPLLTRTNGSKLAMNPLSSWTVNKGESRNWGDTVFRADVPVSQIYSLGMDGVGCLREREVVLLGYPVETHHMSDRDASYASQGWADFSVVSELELACHDASCAPPPVGTGGSKPGGDGQGGSDFDLNSWYEQFGYSAELRGKDPEQYERWAAENKEGTLKLGADKVQALGPVIADSVEKRGVRICVSPDAVRSIILSGRFKSQHETGGSMGAYAPDVRRNAEGWMFGWSPDDPKTAPIYGYVPVPGTQPTFYYGRVVVQLTPEASRRATFTIGDSLGSATPLPVERARNATADEIAGSAATHFAPKAWIQDGQLSYGSYVEAQIHGGVRLEDIEAVYWDETPDMGRVSPVPEDRARELAAALGKEATRLESLVDEEAHKK